MNTEQGRRAFIAVMLLGWCIFPTLYLMDGETGTAIFGYGMAALAAFLLYRVTRKDKG